MKRAALFRKRAALFLRFFLISVPLSKAFAGRGCPAGTDTILITEGKEKGEKETKSSKDPIIQDIPVVVLVNGGSASASEILAGALKDKYGATIVGTNTYGKGVIQTLYSLSNGGGLKITTEEYYTPNHNRINKVGIKPDVEVELTKDSNGNYETSEDKDAQLLKAKEVIQEKIK